jgi:hypothetical protein
MSGAGSHNALSGAFFHAIAARAAMAATAGPTGVAPRETYNASRPQSLSLAAKGIEEERRFLLDALWSIPEENTRWTR